MCNYKSWYFDDNGYVIQCTDCKHFQVSFGTTMLTLNVADFKAFTHLVFSARENHVPVNMEHLKCVVLPTPCSKVQCLLTQAELDTLFAMMQEADTEIKTQQLLSLFNYSV